jgi:hypothetical protein
MPYFPTYQEMEDALDHARLKMWHTHGKVVDFGGPEFTLYVMEGLGKMEAPKILDEPIETDVVQLREELGSTPDPVPVPKVTVTKSFGIEASTREGAADESVHAFVSNRNGKKCLECGEPPKHDNHKIG